MVKTVGISEVDSGYHVGALGSSVYVGWGLSGVFWGHMGDTYGHKHTLFIASVGALCATTAFGFSTTFWWALATRSLHGLFMGMSAVAKSILVKVSDRTNVSLAISIFYSAWTIAFIVGPSVAGFLVFPVEQYPKVFSKNSVFAKYVVLLPNLLLGLCWVVALGFELGAVPDDRKRNDNEELVPLIDKANDAAQKDDPKITENHSGLTSASARSSPLWNRMSNEFGTKDFVICILLYLLIGFVLSGIEEMFPVFAATSSNYNGLQMTTSDIGVVLLGAG